MNYPTKVELKAALKAVCTSDAMCESLASEFGGKEISCNHRVPQMAANRAQHDANAPEEDGAAAATLLCSYVDTAGCKAPKK